MSHRRSPRSGEEEQGYLAAISDLMAGLIFVFLITLMVFALRIESVTSSLQSTTVTRTHILQTIESELTRRGLDVEIDTTQGVLRLTENSIQFPRGSANPLPAHEQNVVTLTEVLRQVLPCFVATAGGPCDLDVDSIRYGGKVDVVLIEGHTDVVPVVAGRYRDNLELSGARAATIWRMMATADRDSILLGSLNRDGESILSIAGYGEMRLARRGVPTGAENRRIDLRFVMEPPDASGIRAADPAAVQATRRRLVGGEADAR